MGIYRGPPNQQRNPRAVNGWVPKVRRNPPIINHERLSPVHFSRQNGVHADIGFGHTKKHVPLIGQTTLPTFCIGGRPTYRNDHNLSGLGGRYRG